MSNDVAGDAQAEETIELPLTALGLIGALARAMEEHQAGVIKPKKDAPKVPLIKGFDEEKRTDLVVEIGGQEVGRYKVNLTRDRFEVADEAAFDAFADSQDEIDIVIVRKKSWEDAVLKYAEMNPETGTIFDSRNGEEIPGLKFVPGGQPTGSVTWTWKKRNGQPVGKSVLLAAYRRGDLNELLRKTPELLPTRQPGASDE